MRDLRIGKPVDDCKNTSFGVLGFLIGCILTPRLLLVVLFGSLVSAAGVMAQKVEFIARASAREVMVGDYFQITYTLKNADGKNFRRPTLKDFHVAGTSSGFKQYNINGKVSSEHNFIVNVIPKKAGNYTIPPGSVVSNGKTIRSNSIKIKVSKASQEQNIDVGNNDGVFLRAELSEKTGFIGQMIALDYVIYTNRYIGRYEIVQLPDIKGVFAKDMPNFDAQNQPRVINGRRYTSRIVHRQILYPQQEGEIEIEPVTMRVALETNMGYQTKSIFSSPQTLVINTMPKPIPSNFSGAVGRFSMTTSLNTNRITTDETLIYKVEISGSGDIKRVSAPDLHLDSNSFIVYDPRIDEGFVEEAGLLVQTKTFEYLIAPKKAGSYELHPTFSYFDVEKNSYETLTAEEALITVLQGSGSGANIAKAEAATRKLNDIQLQSRLYSQQMFYGSNVFWILLFIPVILLMGVIVYWKRLRAKQAIDPKLNKQHKASKVAIQRLEQAQLHLQASDSRAFYDELSKSLWGYVSDKLDIPTAELSKENVQNKLQERNCSLITATQFKEMITKCEMALFASMDNETAMNASYKEAEKLIMELEKMI